jgi:hypothetical protein
MRGSELALCFLAGCVTDPIMPMNMDGGDANSSESTSPVALQGTVIDELGAPVGDVQIAIGDKIATSAADGTFTLMGVTTPYDVVLGFKSDLPTSGKRMTSFQGLSTMTPHLQIAAYRKHVGSFNITSGLTLGATERFGFCVAPSNAATDFAYASPLANPMGPLGWFGQSPISGTGWYIRFSQTGGIGDIPTGSAPYTSIASQAFQSLGDGQTLTVSGLTFTPITHVHVTGAINYKGNTGDTLHMVLRPSPKAIFDFATAFTQGAYDFWVPTAPFTFGVRVRALTPQGGYSTAWTVDHKGDMTATPPPLTVPIALPDGNINTTSPASDATVGTGDKLAWTAVPNAAYVVSLSCPPPAKNVQPIYDADILTFQPTAVVPDTSKVGNVSPPAMARCAWSVTAFTGPKSADDLASAGWQSQAVPDRAIADGWELTSKSVTYNAK